MTQTLPSGQERQAFVAAVEERSMQEIASCYQCGKCTAGCPVAFAMDYPPNQIMRGIQLGMRAVVLESNTIWLCAACETCSTRCPQDVDVAGVMDALRQIATAEGIRSPEREVTLFHRIFLTSVRQNGRIYEAMMLGLNNVLSGHLLKDVMMAPKMLLKGKLGVLPPKGGDTERLKEVFRRARELEEQIG